MAAKIPPGKIRHMSAGAQEQIKQRIEQVSGGLGKQAKANKYGAKKVVTPDGLKFDSRMEYRRWQVLDYLEKGKRIRNLRRQVPYVFDMLQYPSGRTPKYIADFVYEELCADGSWVTVVEDTKGHRTDAYLLKYALMRHFFGIEIRET